MPDVVSDASAVATGPCISLDALSVNICRIVSIDGVAGVVSCWSIYAVFYRSMELPVNIYCNDLDALPVDICRIVSVDGVAGQYILYQFWTCLPVKYRTWSPCQLLLC